MFVRPIRPHFEVEVAGSAEATMERLAEYLQSSRSSVHGWVHPPYAELAVGEDQRHWWSPRLAVHVERDNPTTTTLLCRFQPEPGVWTMYMAVWAMLAVGTMLLIGFGCAQSIAGLSPTVCIYGLPVAAGFGALLYGSAIFGQRLGEPETNMLEEVLRNALQGDAVP